jgi:hypothetical protein
MRRRIVKSMMRRRMRKRMKRRRRNVNLSNF